MPLQPEHKRSNFNCGNDALNRYLQQQATQDLRRRIAACFVAVQEERIAGYYTLASASVLLNHLPAALKKKLPHYPALPAVRLGRLAVDQSFQRQGLGAALLADALERTLRSEIAAYALIVDAKDQEASAFYQHHGFMPLVDSALTLFLPLEKLRTLPSSSH